jgi:hypothetical protein
VFPLKKMIVMILLSASLVGCTNSHVLPASQQESANAHSPTPASNNLDISSLNMPLPPQWRFNVVNRNHSDIIDEKGGNIGGISAIFYEKDFDFKQVKPNHSSVTNEESFDIPLGKCIFFTLDVDNGSAASGLTGTHNEYYAVIQIEEKVIYILSFSMNDKKTETKQQFIDLLKKMGFKDTLVEEELALSSSFSVRG